MAKKIISIKTPLRQIRPQDDERQMILKLNQNYTDIWNILNNLDQRLKELENTRNLVYVKEDRESIIIRTAQGNRKIDISEAE